MATERQSFSGSASSTTALPEVDGILLAFGRAVVLVAGQLNVWVVINVTPKAPADYAGVRVVGRLRGGSVFIDVAVYRLPDHLTWPAAVGFLLLAGLAVPQGSAQERRPEGRERTQGQDEASLQCLPT